MSGLNRRGPMGEGPMTGRRMGRCNPVNKGKTMEEIIQNNESSVHPEQGFGLGRGRRLGRGMGFGRGMGMQFRGGDI